MRRGANHTMQRMGASRSAQLQSGCPLRLAPTADGGRFGDATRLGMKTLARLLPVIALLFSGCGYVHDEKLTGPYRLIAVDVDEQMNVSYSLPNGSAVGRIPETVFSVGWNDRYIVAKQHPKNNRSITNYYYLDMSHDSAYADPSASVTGPLAESDFLRRRTEIGLPDFSRTVKALQ